MQRMRDKLVSNMSSMMKIYVNGVITTQNHPGPKAMVFLLFVLRIRRPSILGFWKKNKIAFTYFFYSRRLPWLDLFLLRRKLSFYQQINRL